MLNKGIKSVQRGRGQAAFQPVVILSQTFFTLHCIAYSILITFFSSQSIDEYIFKVIRHLAKYKFLEQPLYRVCSETKLKTMIVSCDWLHSHYYIIFWSKPPIFRQYIIPKLMRNKLVHYTHIPGLSQNIGWDSENSFTTEIAQPSNSGQLITG